MSKSRGRLSFGWSVALLIAALSAESSSAYPIPKPSRRAMIHHSEMILHVRVESVATRRCTDRKAKWATTELRVLRVLKGNVRANEIVTVSFDDYLICPAPPEFEAGEEQIVFVRPPLDDGSLHIAFLSHGQLRRASAATADSVAAEIAGFNQIVAERDEAKQKRLQIEWMFARLNNTNSRDDALYDLSECARPTLAEIVSPVLLKLDPSEAEKSVHPPDRDLAIDLKVDLTEEQRKALLDAMRIAATNDRNRYTIAELQGKLERSNASQDRSTPGTSPTPLRAASQPAPR